MRPMKSTAHDSRRRPKLAASAVNKVRGLGSVSFILLSRLIAVIAMMPASGFARDLGQWDDVDEATRVWYQMLMQPDTIDTAHPISCCGESDAYWADSVEVQKDGTIVAIVTDDRDDSLLKRSHVPIGTRFVVPPNKITRKDGNPTGHVVLFLGTTVWFNGETSPDKRAVLCYVMGSGA